MKKDEFMAYKMENEDEYGISKLFSGVDKLFKENEVSFHEAVTGQMGCDDHHWIILLIKITFTFILYTKYNRIVILIELYYIH